MDNVPKQLNVSKSVDAIYLLLSLNFITQEEFNSIYRKIKEYGESR